ncbi:FecCD family ABC transporter permease [Paenactinomyces guangxiensis]|uniref:Iron ABC transporter permease n=1 Tax=Paenactinomyces guangxiensis TaxID=1490290 RepID=A0A7W1WRN4_9BACL|nr:iron ABC transporter permease [Paenactinomyces guangxiensis]MBA4494817.1 iron ABC transporter permease [Paenactinomyces guangxiensis]MBH8591900.1 iron ABC transporter permease [Paenactinomyces guangxiensis]
MIVQTSRGKRFLFWSGGLFLCFLFSFSIAVSLGSTEIDAGTVWKVILVQLGVISAKGGGFDPASAAIVWQLRLPRVLLAAAVGAALALAGTVFQGLLKNPLADPYILGVSSGSSVGAALVMVTGWGLGRLGGWTISAFSFAGGCLALLLVLRLAKTDIQLRTESLILSGVVINAFFGAVLTLIISVSDEEMQRIQFWLFGSFTLKEWQHVWAVVPVLCIAFIISWIFSRELNLFALGDRSASHLGVSVLHVRLFLLIVASLLTAVAVSVSGAIGFVGLVIPHVMRMLTGADHRTLLPLSALAGAIFLIWGDCLARLLISPAELPVGVITAFVGAPFFACILKKNQHKLSA